MALGARTWYPARDERNGIYQLQKAEERAALQHAAELRRIDRLREIRMSHDLRHGTPLGAAYNLVPGYLASGVSSAAHHPLCNTAGSKVGDSRSPPKIGMSMPATQLGARGLANNGQTVQQTGQLKSNAKHDVGQAQNKHQNSINQGFAHANQNGGSQNGNHQKTGDKQSFGNQQNGKPQNFANQQNGNQQNGNPQHFANQHNGNQQNGNQQIGKPQHSSNQQNINQRDSGIRQNSNQPSFGARNEDHRSLGNQQTGNQRIIENQKDTGIQQKFGAQQGFSSNKHNDSRQGGGMEQQCYSRNDDHHIYKKTSNTFLSPMKNGERDASQLTSFQFGNEDLNEHHSKVGFSQSPQCPMVGKVTYVPPPTYLNKNQSFQPRVQSRGEMHAGDRVSRDHQVVGGGRGWNGFSSEPHHVHSHDHYDYLLGKEIGRVLSLASVGPGGISYGHRRSSFSGF